MYDYRLLKGEYERKELLIPIVFSFGLLFLNPYGKKKNDEIKTRVESEGFEGIIVNEEEVKKGVCKRIAGTDLYFMKGVVGALNDEQKRTLCKKVITVYPSRDVVELPLQELLTYIEVIDERLKAIEKKLSEIENKV